MGSTLGCRLKILGIVDYKLDEFDNLLCVDSIKTPIVVLPYGLKGLLSTGFSGLDLEVLKFNKDLCNFELTSLSNCNKLRELYVYERQLDLVKDLKFLYPNLQILIRKGL